MLDAVLYIALKVLFYYVVLNLVTLPALIVGRITVEKNSWGMIILSVVLFLISISFLCFGLVDILTDIYPLITGGIK